MKSTKSRRHQKNQNRDLKDAKDSLENAEKVEKANLDLAKAEGDRLGKTVADPVEIGSGEENVVDRQG